MKTQIIITELDDGYQWVVVKNNEVIGFGYENDSFQAFKQAHAVYNRI